MLPAVLAPNRFLAILTRISYALSMNTRLQRLDALDENQIVDRLRKILPSVNASVLHGIGDDCAVVRLADDSTWDLLLTSDPVVEGRHFLGDTPPEQIGRKAIGRVLSDLAAMGGDPLWALINLVAPPNQPIERVEGIYRGVAEMAGRHGLMVVGGDVTAGPTLELHVFAVGRVPAGTALLRSGAQAGDWICVTGALGGSRAGRQFSFTPRLNEGRFLREGRWATALMDLTDGLASDLPRLVSASGVGAELELDKIPIHSDTRLTERTPLCQALEDGEDFELLFTVPDIRMAGLRQAWPGRGLCDFTPIGRMVSGPPEIWGAMAGIREKIEAGGFDHFNDRVASPPA